MLIDEQVFKSLKYFYKDHESKFNSWDIYYNEFSRVFNSILKNDLIGQIDDYFICNTFEFHCMNRGPESIINIIIFNILNEIGFK